MVYQSSHRRNILSTLFQKCLTRGSFNDVWWQISIFRGTILNYILSVSLVQFSSVTHSCSTLCDPMNFSTPGLPVHHHLPEFTQTHDHRVRDAIQPSHPLSSTSPLAFNPSQYHSPLQWVSSSHQVAKALDWLTPVNHHVAHWERMEGLLHLLWWWKGPPHWDGTSFSGDAFWEVAQFWKFW